jgi:hypothetical protein
VRLSKKEVLPMMYDKGILDKFAGVLKGPID